MEKHFAALVGAFLQGGTRSTSQPYITFSQQAQNALIEAIAGLLQEAHAIGVQHGQAMLPQERAISFSSPRDLLARAAEIVAGIIEHAREAISNAFSKGQTDDSESLSPSDIVDETMNNLIESMPELIAGDEVTTAIEAAVFDEMTRFGVAQMQSVSEGDGKVCARCQANEDEGPINIGDSFKTGDSVPPYHNRCRCNIVPA